MSEFMSLMYRREGGGIVVKQEVKLEAADSSTADSPPPFSSGARDGARNNGDSPEEGNNPVQQGPEEVGAVNRCQDQEDDSDSDVVMVEEVIKSYVAVIGVVDAEEKAKSRVVEEVVIQDEEQLLAQPKSPPIASSSSGASTVLIPRGGKNVSFSIPQKSGAGRKRKAAPIRVTFYLFDKYQIKLINTYLLICISMSNRATSSHRLQIRVKLLRKVFGNLVVQLLKENGAGKSSRRLPNRHIPWLWRSCQLYPTATMTSHQVLHLLGCIYQI